MLAFASQVPPPAAKIGAQWCSLVHDAPTWPIHGRYQCRVCGRRYAVPWAESKSDEALGACQGRLPAIRSTLVPVLLSVLALPGAATDNSVVNSRPAAAVALARYTSNEQQPSRWPLETIEIDASLPNLNKNGRLRAIRRLFAGHPHYQVLEMAGDPVVRQQVIARYLSADERTTDFPASSMAMTPANYMFNFVGVVPVGGHVAYAFRIIPRKKRQGLINGVLWLDGETGIAIRRSGSLVKSPSLFIKRVDLTSEDEVRDGIVEARVTHVSIETRLVGRAKLLIVERPSSIIGTESPVTGAGQ